MRSCKPAVVDDLAGMVCRHMTNVVQHVSAYVVSSQQVFLT